MIKIQTALILTLLLLLPVSAKNQLINTVDWIELPIGSKQILCQGSDFTCGYVSVLNSLRFGCAADQHVFDLLKGQTNQERIKYLVDKYGTKPSKEVKNQQRQRAQGVGCEDLNDIYNELRVSNGLLKMAGVYLDRQKEETSKQQLERIHELFYQSLIQGEPPIVFLCSEAAQWHPTASQLIWKMGGAQDQGRNASSWNLLAGHTLTVIGVPKSVNSDGSFAMNYLNPAHGKKEQLFLYSNVRNFSAGKGSCGKVQWLEDRPFLTASGGMLTLNTQKQPWHARTEIYLYYAIYKK